FLVYPHGGSVYLYDLVAGPALDRRAVMPLGQRIAIGGGFSVTRVKAEARLFDSVHTDLLRPQAAEQARLSLVNGGGSEARALHLGREPISIGSAPDNALTLSDRAVSRYHCRIEPAERSCSIRDLSSTNGTWVDGVRVQQQALRPGTTLRVGRTELRVVNRGAEGKRPNLVAHSAPMLAVMAEADRFAGLPWPVLIRGETGVGKEHVARALHERGPRSSGPFVALNGGGLPRELIESELFGHERGAFTGAARAHRGAFERAHAGTLFLDEVAELPLDLQTRLLRVLETWRVRRLGGERERRVDVRLICATHGDLRAEVERGRFRADLFYRIHRMVLDVPPLRARPSDIAALSEHFLANMEAEVGRRCLTSCAVERLCGHLWPGNVRELRNVLELAAVDGGGGPIDQAAVERALGRIGQSPLRPPSADTLREALEHYRGNLSATARALGIPRSTLRDRLRGRTQPEG
ncbi:MAG: sigma 54-dependent Fis family transcriptional regulator, partial [Deltaproteobacteria bacterium]|nr:sigma 54-dependent Fis family transcriptional regulator [Deltaproteobacteria bacterium]